jgi:hypothetical protein
MSEGPTERSIDRRSLLRRGAAVGALAWTAPVVQSLTWSAAAGERSGYPHHPPPGSPKPCVVKFKIHFCRTYRTRVYKHGKFGYNVTQKWFEVTLPINVSGECCELINQAVGQYQSSSRTENECLYLIWKLIKSGCFKWDDWSCKVDDDYKPGDHH